MPEEDRLKLDGVFAPVGQLVLKIVGPNRIQEALHEFLVRFDRAQRRLEILPGQ